MAVIRGAPHPREAKQLVDFLLSPQVEEMLAEGPSAQIPLSSQVPVLPRVASPHTVRAMEVDFEAAAAQWDAAATFLRDLFATAN